MGCLTSGCHHADLELILAHCDAKNIKLTLLRQQVLTVISEADKPLTAYVILDELKKVKPKAQVMSVYRVLSFLQEHELIHRIESLNAFMICHHMADKEHSSQWLICEQCGDATECDLPAFQHGLDAVSNSTGFTITTPVIELTGICANCVTESA